jgi:predicted DNA-binding WGR domain protein
MIYLERIDPARNMARFYRIIVTPTLFGDWSLIREWGRIGSPGTVRETWYDDEAAARRAGEQRVQQQLRRGYRRR